MELEMNGTASPLPIKRQSFRRRRRTFRALSTKVCFFCAGLLVGLLLALLVLSIDYSIQSRTQSGRALRGFETTTRRQLTTRATTEQTTEETTAFVTPFESIVLSESHVNSSQNQKSEEVLKESTTHVINASNVITEETTTQNTTQEVIPMIPLQTTPQTTDTTEETTVIPTTRPTTVFTTKQSPKESPEVTTQLTTRETTTEIIRETTTTTEESTKRATEETEVRVVTRDVTRALLETTLAFNETSNETTSSPPEVTTDSLTSPNATELTSRAHTMELTTNSTELASNTTFLASNTTELTSTLSSELVLDTTPNSSVESINVTLDDTPDNTTDPSVVTILPSNETSVSMNTTSLETNATVWPMNTTLDSNETSILSSVNTTTTTTTVNETSVVSSTLSSNETFCLSSEFLCPKETLCLSEDHKCDGIIDCRNDAFDESLCDDCGVNFRCGNFCISRQNYCDGLWDCPSGEDEVGCHVLECRKGEFLCKDLKRCIKGKQACDHVSHCDDHSDEIGCVNREKCETENRFFCSDGLCIEGALRCDAQNDCNDGSDENDCQTSVTCSQGFLCDNNECVSRDKRCDDRDDCLDASDEFFCVTRDSNNTVLKFARDGWHPLCAHNVTSRDAHSLCQRMGEWKAITWSSKTIKPLDDFWTTVDDNSLSRDCPDNLTLVLNCSDVKCGDQINGTDAPPPSLPIRDQKSGVECPAHVLSSNWLLTSASCLSKLSQNSSLLSVSGLPVSKLMPHFRHSLFRSLRISDFDVALVRTRLPLPPTPICLPPHAVDPAITCFSDSESTLEVLETRLCNGSLHFNGSLTSRHLCADAEKVLSPGAPLLCLSSDSKWYLSGFLSFQYRKYSHVTHPKVFSNVFSVKQWILRAIGKHSENLEKVFDDYHVTETTTTQTTVDDMTTTEVSNQTSNELKAFEKKTNDSLVSNNSSEETTIQMNSSLFETTQMTTIDVNSTQKQISFNSSNAIMNSSLET